MPIAMMPFASYAKAGVLRSDDPGRYATAVRFTMRPLPFLAFPEIWAPFAHGLSGIFISQKSATAADAWRKIESGKGPGSAPREGRSSGRESGSTCLALRVNLGLGVPQKCRMNCTMLKK